MTLSTEAEHAFGDEVDYVTSEAMSECDVLADVEDALMNAENRDGVSEDTPAVVDIHSVVESARDSRGEAVTSAARCFTDSDAVADAAARDIFEHVEDIARHMTEQSPYLEAFEDLGDSDDRVLIDEATLDV